LATPAELDLRVVLVATRNPLNLGAAARAMANFGFAGLRVVNPYELAFREARSAVGASELLARAEEFKSVSEAVADCSLVIGTTVATRRDLHHPLRDLPAAARLIRRHRGRVALLFGSEKRGLSNADLSHCHWLLRIPTSAAQPSMNLAQAVAVCLYELSRMSSPHDQRPAKSNRRPMTSDQRPATSDANERLTGLLLDSLRASGYLKPRAGAETEEKIRRLLRRLGLTAEDAQLWLGIFHQIAWKLRHH
jgi:TrmH family RNA methyltransferase